MKRYRILKATLASTVVLISGCSEERVDPAALKLAECAGFFSALSEQLGGNLEARDESKAFHYAASQADDNTREVDGYVHGLTDRANGMFSLKAEKHGKQAVFDYVTEETASCMRLKEKHAELF